MDDTSQMLAINATLPGLKQRLVENYGSEDTFYQRKRTIQYVPLLEIRTSQGAFG
jgi:hypothetical protein